MPWGSLGEAAGFSCARGGNLVWDGRADGAGGAEHLLHRLSLLEAPLHTGSPGPGKCPAQKASELRSRLLLTQRGKLFWKKAEVGKQRRWVALLPSFAAPLNAAAGAGEASLSETSPAFRTSHQGWMHCGREAGVEARPGAAGRCVGMDEGFEAARRWVPLPGCRGQGRAGGVVGSWHHAPKGAA